MTVRQKSVAAWIGGGVAGAALAKDRRLLGGLLGAIVVGPVADVLIERRQRRLPMTGAIIGAAALFGLTGWILTTYPKKT